jgi:iron complex transport system permease protein
MRQKPMTKITTTSTKPGYKLILMLLLLLVIFICCVCVGSQVLTPWTVFKGILGQSDPQVKLILDSLRLPRAYVAILSGAALGMSGTLLQGTIRNPLAAPNIIGITGGGSLAAVIFLNLFPNAPISFMPLAIFFGALLVTILVYALSWKRGVSPTRLILVGIGISSVTSAMTTLIIAMSTFVASDKAYLWMVGSVYGVTWKDVKFLLPWISISFICSMTYARHLDVQGLGDDIALGLGAHLQRHRAILTLLSVALAGGAIAVVGAIGFIGLVAPHMGRRLIGANHRALIPASALLGAMILLVADTVARTLFLPIDVPAGVFTALIGAPFFIYQLYHQRNQ